MIVGGSPPAAAAGGQAFSDSFTGTSGNPSANWTEYGGGHWELSSNTLLMNYLTTDEFIAYTGQALDTGDQYIRIKFVEAQGSTYNRYRGVIFRWTNSTSPFYLLMFYWNGSNQVVSLQYLGNISLSGQTQVGDEIVLTQGAGDVFGCTLEGTGTGTKWRVWKNPTATTPVSASEWDSGDTTPDAYDVVIDPGVNAVDAGAYIGIYAYGASSNYSSFDDFYGGDIP